MITRIKMFFLKMKLNIKSFFTDGSLRLKFQSYRWTFISSIVALLLILFMLFFVTLPSMSILKGIAWKNFGWLVLCSLVIIFDLFLYDSYHNYEETSKQRKIWYFAWIAFTILIFAILMLYGQSVQSLWQ